MDINNSTFFGYYTHNERRYSTGRQHFAFSNKAVWCERSDSCSQHRQWMCCLCMCLQKLAAQIPNGLAVHFTSLNCVSLMLFYMWCSKWLLWAQAKWEAVYSLFAVYLHYICKYVHRYTKICVYTNTLSLTACGCLICFFCCCCSCSGFLWLVFCLFGCLF